MDLAFWFTILAGMAMGCGATLYIQRLVRREEDQWRTDAWDEVRAVMRHDDRLPDVDWDAPIEQAKRRHPAYRGRSHG